MKKLFRVVDNIIWRNKMPRVPELSAIDLELPTDELAWKTASRSGEVLDEARGACRSKVRFLPVQWRFVWVMVELDGQVLNGGFHQFFTNTRGIFDSHFSEDIALLEHHEYRSVITRAFDLYQGIDYRAQWRNIGKSWGSFIAPYSEGRFDKEDAEFFNIKPSLSEVVGQHIRIHVNDFIKAT